MSMCVVHFLLWVWFVYGFFFFFFFKQKTAYEMRISDWSSDVCSSDLSGVGMVPLGAVLHNPPGSIGGRQPANTTMRPHMVVVVAPEPQHRAGMAERHEQRLVEALVTQAAVEALDIAVLLRLARRDVVPLDRRSEEQTSELQSLM